MFHGTSHSCAYGARRFGHVIMEYRGRVVSLLMTTNDGGTGNVEQDAIPHLIGRPTNGLSVVSVNRTHHAILVVSDLEGTELAKLSETVSVPLARRLEVSRLPPRDGFASLNRQSLPDRTSTSMTRGWLPRCTSH